jgi:hypothetical protein
MRSRSEARSLVTMVVADSEYRSRQNPLEMRAEEDDIRAQVLLAEARVGRSERLKPG